MQSPYRDSFLFFHFAASPLALQLRTRLQHVPINVMCTHNFLIYLYTQMKLGSTEWSEGATKIDFGGKHEWRSSDRKTALFASRFQHVLGRHQRFQSTPVH